MKLTANQVSDLYIDVMNSHPGMVKSEVVWNEFTEELNKLIELETCHELALAQNVAVDSIEEFESDTYQNIYKSLYMRPEAPPHSTRAQLLLHILDNEKDGKSINDGIAVIGNDKYWYPVTLEHSVNLHKPENYRIIK